MNNRTRLALLIGFAGPPTVRACVGLAAALLAASAGAAPGELDPSFDGDGLVVTDFPSLRLESASALVRQPDGKLVAAGSVRFFDQSFGLAR